MIRTIAATTLMTVPTLALAQTLEIQPVTDNVWAIVGETEQRSPANLANNATFGLVVTDEGAVLIDPGGSYKGAKILHEAIRGITDQPVTYVINTGGQDHRWLGNSYWQETGAKVIASEAAVADQLARGSMQLSTLAQLLGDGLEGTDPSHADITFVTDHILDFGGLSFEIMHRGSAHTPGDAFVWLDERNVMFTGDIVYVDRILGTGPAHNVKSWIGVFEAMAAFDPRHIVPGHGNATDLNKARRQTYDYLVNLRTQTGELIEAGGDIMDATTIDQSDWSYLKQFDSLSGSNTQATYEQMEWE
tara:strand:+ start:11148 stop:12059 length:912 start_codon:yes stop_codon:yes gene_type:complete